MKKRVEFEEGQLEKTVAILLESTHLKMTKEEIVISMLQNGTNPRTVRAFMEVPREEFVPPQLKQFAYFNCALPIGYEQTISQPEAVLVMLDALELQPNHNVLEIGAGRGYNASLLGKLARKVTSAEVIPELVQGSKERLAHLGYSNVSVVEANRKSIGHPPVAPYDRIVVTAGAERVPIELINQLAVGGIMIIPNRLTLEDQGIEDADFMITYGLWKIKKEKSGPTASFLTQCNFVPLQYGPEATVTE